MFHPNQPSSLENEQLYRNKARFYYLYSKLAFFPLPLFHKGLLFGHQFLYNHYRSEHAIFQGSSCHGNPSTNVKKIHKTIGPNKKIADINVSRERHRVIINKTLEYLKKSLSQKNIDLFAEDIRYANKEVSKISGNIDIEDILDIIFNDFCIGK